MCDQVFPSAVTRCSFVDPWQSAYDASIILARVVISDADTMGHRPKVLPGILVLAAVIAALAGSLDARSATPPKTLRVTFQAAESGFDPVKVSDYYSGTIIEQIFEPLLTYDYLARPVKLVPNVAESVPSVSEDGKTYTFTIRRGVYFSDDPAFKGQRRELTAHDYAYSIKRFLDPRNRSPYAFLFEGKIVGLDEAAAQATKPASSITTQRIAGLETPDRYTLRIRLTNTDFNFSHVLAFTPYGRSRARGDRSIRRRHERPSGGHRSFQARKLHAFVEDRPGSEPVVSRGDLELLARRRSARPRDRRADAAGRSSRRSSGSK